MSAGRGDPESEDADRTLQRALQHRLRGWDVQVATKAGWRVAHLSHPSGADLGFAASVDTPYTAQLQQATSSPLLRREIKGVSRLPPVRNGALLAGLKRAFDATGASAGTVAMVTGALVDASVLTEAESHWLSTFSGEMR